MKHLTGSMVLFLLLTLACTPKNEEVQTAHAEPEKAATDSIIKPEKDGTATTHTHESPKLPLPQPVLQLLAEKYPGWKEPVLMEGVIRRASGNNQGPLTVRADFDGDNQQDIALQIRHKKNVVIVALLQDSTHWQLHELKKDILFNDRGAYKSLYYIFLTEAGTSLYDYGTRQNITTKHDAVSVGINNNATTFVYEENSFKPYDVVD